MTVNTERSDAIVIRFMENRLIDAERNQQIQEELFAIAESGDARHVILEMDNVVFISTAMLFGLLQTRRKLDERNRRLYLCGLHPEIREIFMIAEKHTGTFEFLSSTEQVLAG